MKPSAARSSGDVSGVEDKVADGAENANAIKTRLVSNFERGFAPEEVVLVSVVLTDQEVKVSICS